MTVEKDLQESKVGLSQLEKCKKENGQENIRFVLNMNDNNVAKRLLNILYMM